MVTNGYSRPHGIQPGSLAAALALSAAMVSGLVMSSPAVKGSVDKIFKVIQIPIDPPPPVDPAPKQKPSVLQKTQPAPKPVDATTSPIPATSDDFATPITTGTIDGVGTMPIETILPPPPLPPAPPVLREAAVDPRYAAALQPDYPAGERRAGNEGKVTVRVLIGTDGRVHQVERVSAASDAFFTATQRQAMSKWRFTPATRDGVPIESWRTMTVRFEMES